MKFPGIPLNSRNFTKFGSFWANVQKISKCDTFEQLFKAKKEAFRELPRKWSFCAQNRFLGENPVLGRISCLFGQKGHFAGSGPPKHLPEPYVYVGFYAGGPEVNFGPKKGTFGLRNAKNAGIPLFLVKWRGTL